MPMGMPWGWAVYWMSVAVLVVGLTLYFFHQQLWSIIRDFAGRQLAVLSWGWFQYPEFAKQRQ